MKLSSYPLPPGLQTFADLSITVDGQPMCTEALHPAYPAGAPEWFARPRTLKPEVNIARFACAGPCQLTISTVKPLTSLIVRPKSLQIPIEIGERQATLNLPGPCKLYVEIDDLPPLFIFADPIETDAPAADAPGVRVFAPGEHTPGLITLQDNDRIYLAPGAIVYGGFRGSPTNARVFGRGILDGSRLNESMVRLHGAKNVEFADIIMRCGKTWQNTLTNCDNISYRNVKVLSFAPYGDGIDPVCSRNIHIDNCFIYASDDCIAIKAMREGPEVSNILVTDSILAGYVFGDGLTIGFETDTTRMSNVIMRNCDVLYALGPNKIDGHSAFSIICDGPATIENVLFEDIAWKRTSSNSSNYTSPMARVTSTKAPVQSPASPCVTFAGRWRTRSFSGARMRNIR